MRRGRGTGEETIGRWVSLPPPLRDTAAVPMPETEQQKIRQAVWIMAVYVGFMVIGLVVAFFVPLLLQYDGQMNGSITRTPPAAMAESTPRP